MTEDINRQKEIIMQIHRRAHRNYKNNAQEILTTYFWPTLRQMCKKETQGCKICLTNKYERSPNKQPIGAAPIPNHVGEHIHLDLFHINGNTYISTTDKYSKYLYIRETPRNKNTYKYIDEILSQIYPNAKYVMTENKSTFTSICAKQVYEKLQIVHTDTPTFHSTTKGQVERTHSTLIELAKVLAQEHNHSRKTKFLTPYDNKTKEFSQSQEKTLRTCSSIES